METIHHATQRCVPPPPPSSGELPPTEPEIPPNTEALQTNARDVCHRMLDFLIDSNDPDVSSLEAGERGLLTLIHLARAAMRTVAEPLRGMAESLERSSATIAGWAFDDCDSQGAASLQQAAHSVAQASQILASVAYRHRCESELKEVVW